MRWKNEYNGTWHDGVEKEGIAEFLGGGNDAVNWFENIVKPAMLAKMGTETV